MSTNYASQEETISSQNHNRWIFRHRFQHYVVWIPIDILSVIISYSIVYFLRTFSSVDVFANTILFISFAIIINILTLQSTGVYRRLWKQTSGNGVRVLITAGLLATPLITLINLSFSQQFLPITVVLVGQMASVVMFTSTRYRSRLIRGISWRWNAVWNQQFPERLSRSRVLVVGAGSSGQLFVAHYNRVTSQERDIEIIGFADDNPQKQGMLIEGKPVLGQLSDIPSIVRLYEIKKIVLAIHKIPGPKFRSIVDICHSTEADVKIMPDVLRLNARQQSFSIRDVRIEDLIGRPSLHDAHRIDLAPIKERVVMITGAAGSVGSELSRQLARCDIKQLLVLDNNESGLYDLVGEIRREHGTKIEIAALLCDVTNQTALEWMFKKYQPQVVFHAAAYKHVPLLEDHPYEAVRVNLGGTYNTAQLAQKYHAERFVLVSTDKAVNSASVMGATKYLCEQIVRALPIANPQYDTLMTAVRFGNVLGSRGSVAPLFERQIQEGGPVTVTDERMTRYFMSIPEAAHLVIQAGCMTRGSDLFVLEMGESVRILELAERMIRLHNLRPYVDIPIKFIGIRPGETLHERLIIPGEKRHPTSHPYISTYASPIIDETMFLDKLQTLFTEEIRRNTSTLKTAVVDLAQHVQVNYEAEPEQVAVGIS